MISDIALATCNPISSLEKYLEVSETRFNTCINALPQTPTIDGLEAKFAFHYVKFDANTNEPKFGLLAKALAKHIVRYCISAKSRDDIRRRLDYEDDEGELFLIAREYFRKIHDSGEVGELLLFFLLEAVFKAPQVVCKMELKTNPGDEVKGTDGIHVKWDVADDHLDIYLGESKLYTKIGSALTDALASVQKLYDENKLDQELHLVTSHFKHLDQSLQDQVTRWTNRETSASECHVIHSCLIGWDWPHYKKLNDDRALFLSEFEDKYRGYVAKIGNLVSTRFEQFKYKHLSFQFLFIPFTSVGEFRKAFYRELLGVDL